MALNKKTVLTNNDTQFSEHIELILKSGLLLDEDLDSILHCYNADDYTDETDGLSRGQIFLATFSITSTIRMLKKELPFLYVTISAVPCLVIAVHRIKAILRRRKRNDNIQRVVEMACNLSKLNRMIYEYFKHRNIVDPNTSDILNPYTKGMKQLIKTLFLEEVNLLYIFRIFIREFGTYVPLIQCDYAYLENLEFDDFTSSNVNSINDCVTYVQKLCDIYALVISNCLTCLAITLCPSFWREYEFSADPIVDKIVPKMRRTLEQCYQNINRKFDDLKYYYFNRHQIKKQFKKPKPNAATKLQISTHNMLVYTSEILEKSEIIYNKLQEVDFQNITERENLAACIAELRGHVFDYYDSLDVLYKLYEANINASSTKPIFTPLKVEDKPQNGNAVIVQDASLNQNEPSDDEEYELYIGGNENSSEGTNISYYEEQESRKFASLLSQELKQKLKTHAQFVAARKKRGIVDEVPEPVEKETEESLPPIIHVLDNIEEKNESASSEFSSFEVLPPPPPPPLPAIDLGSSGGNIGNPSTVNDFLSSITAASKNRNFIEDVFGSSPDE